MDIVTAKGTACDLKSRWKDTLLEKVALFHILGSIKNMNGVFAQIFWLIIPPVPLSASLLTTLWGGPSSDLHPLVESTVSAHWVAGLQPHVAGGLGSGFTDLEPPPPHVSSSTWLHLSLAGGASLPKMPPSPCGYLFWICGKYQPFSMFSHLVFPPNLWSRDYWPPFFTWRNSS